MTEPVEGVHQGGNGEGQGTMFQDLDTITEQVGKVCVTLASILALHPRETDGSHHHVIVAVPVPLTLLLLESEDIVGVSHILGQGGQEFHGQGAGVGLGGTEGLRDLVTVVDQGTIGLELNMAGLSTILGPCLEDVGNDGRMDETIGQVGPEVLSGGDVEVHSTEAEIDILGTALESFFVLERDLDRLGHVDCSRAVDLLTYL